MPGVKDRESENQTWSLMFWRLLTSGRSLSVAPESRIVASGKQVEGQRHHSRELLWPEGSSFVTEWTDRRGQGPHVNRMGLEWKTTSQGTTWPMLILQSCRIIGANIINQIQDLLRITLCSIEPRTHFLKLNHNLGFQLNFVCKDKWCLISLLIIIFKTGFSPGRSC